MSDFLSGFSEKKEGSVKPDHKNKKQVVAPSPSVDVKDEVAAKQNQKQDIKKSVEAPEASAIVQGQVNVRPVVEALSDENVSASDTLSEKKASESSIKQEQTYLRDEPTEFDPSFKKKQNRTRILIALGVIVALVASGFTYYLSTTVKMIDFKDKNISEVRSWASTNRIEVNSETVFSNEISLNVVMSQDVPEGKRIKKGSTLNLELSKGSDPDEVLGLMAFDSSNEKTIREWLEKNKIDNLKISKVFDEKIASGDFIKVELNDKDLSPELFKRKDAGTIYISKGTESFEKTIVVPDFKDKGKSEVEAFHSTNKFKNPFVYEEAYSDTIEMGKLISQSFAKDEKIGIDDVMTLVISKGKARVVPNYAGTNKDTFETVEHEGMNISKLEWFSTSIPFGEFVSQTTNPGTDVTEDLSFSMRVYYSVGKPYISGLKGTSEGKLAEYFFDLNSRGANMTYVVQYRNSCAPKGQVFETSHDEQHVALDEKIWVTVSSGEGTNCESPTE